jgi:hypothetical protein
MWPAEIYPVTVGLKNVILFHWEGGWYAGNGGCAGERCLWIRFTADVQKEGEIHVIKLIIGHSCVASIM